MTPPAARRAARSPVRRAVVGLAAAGLASVGLAAGGPAAAQAPRRAVVPEVRAEGVGSSPLLLAAAGLFADAGLYGRVGVTVGAGTAATGARGLVGEATLVGRFVLDPLRQAARGVYAGAGVGVRGRSGASERFLVGMVGVEGRGRGRVVPAVEVGVGGGMRVAVALRRARVGRR